VGQGQEQVGKASPTSEPEVLSKRYAGENENGKREETPLNVLKKRTASKATMQESILSLAPDKRPRE